MSGLRAEATAATAGWADWLFRYQELPTWAFLRYWFCFFVRLASVLSVHFQSKSFFLFLFRFLEEKIPTGVLTTLEWFCGW